MSNSEQYIKRCIELASRGIGKVAPNPPVGSVIVHNNRIIGEGWHQAYGKAHAEVMAINSVAKKDRPLLKQSTLYVSLEPCNHYGKTPPCTLTIIQNEIPNVVIGTSDPNPHVAGHGIQVLREAGIQVTEPVLQDECEWLIRRFKVHAQNQTYFILKWAESQDGFMGQADKQIWLSNAFSKTLSHKWRSQIDGILVGNRTVRIDNPQLTNRLYGVKTPTRIVFDVESKITDNQFIMNDDSKTIIINSTRSEVVGSNHFERIDSSLDPFDQLQQICQRHQLYTVMIEGGRETLQRIIDQKRWHEAWIIRTTKVCSDGIKSPEINGRFVSSYPMLTDHIDVLSRFAS